MKAIDITSIRGFKLGHAQHEEGGTGCTVIISEQGAKGGVSVRGGSPGTRETDLLKSENLVEDIHAVFLAGGSAYGLDVAGGVMESLEGREIGFDVSVGRVPIVPGAILFDLTVGSPNIRPNQLMGYNASEQAFKKSPFSEGNVGAGTGASVGKAFGNEYAMKGGIGWSAVQSGNIQVGAVVAVNCFGDVIDPNTRRVLAGAYERAENKFLHSDQGLLDQLEANTTNRFSENTSIGAVLTNAQLTKPQANKIASIAHDGFARTMKPSHTFVDGDTLFTLSSGREPADLNGLSMLAQIVVERAVLSAVKSAASVYGLPAYPDVYKEKSE
ncbi:P1 family peptidase [Halobacillus salinarum]|uniref:P1 family peptidase n=1 Tax=Halobacillus salinarum TaxID=2932257 RepID=A0ABY4EGP2_9BACI|nr:P1 family peptidase [Halobacillus salinarum]UOQ42794.1 P1 family peptidase [Halobacillus salinarum]